MKELLTQVFIPSEQSDGIIFFSLIVLSFIGLCTVGSASMGTTVGNLFGLVMVIGKQAFFFFIGYIAMNLCSKKFNTDSVHSNGFMWLIAGIEILLLICLFFPAVNGAKAWLRVGVGPLEITIQPSEFAKIFAFLIIACFLGNNARKCKYPFRTLMLTPVSLIFLYVITIMFLKHDSGSAVILLGISYICLLIPENRSMTTIHTCMSWFFLIAVIITVILCSPYGKSIIAYLPLAEYQKNRFLSSLNPFMDRYGNGYQLVPSLTSFARGGLRGVGFGKSIQKYAGFPEANTDYILAILVEEFGFIGFMILILLYTLIIMRLLIYAVRIKDEIGRIVLIGTSMYFMLHIFLNVGGVTGMIPLTGVPLPLISSGGSSAVAFYVSIGLSQAVICQYRKKEIR